MEATCGNAERKLRRTTGAWLGSTHASQIQLDQNWIPEITFPSLSHTQSTAVIIYYAVCATESTTARLFRHKWETGSKKTRQQNSFLATGLVSEPVSFFQFLLILFWRTEEIRPAAHRSVKKTRDSAHALLTCENFYDSSYSHPKHIFTSLNAPYLLFIL